MMGGIELVIDDICYARIAGETGQNGGFIGTVECKHGRYDTIPHCNCGKTYEHVI